jgi:hypothetical protein
VPLATRLVALHGWRDALLWLAAILALLTVPAHALLIRRRPEDHGLLPDGGPLLSDDGATGPDVALPRPAPEPACHMGDAGSSAAPRAAASRDPHTLAAAATARAATDSTLREAVGSASFRWLLAAFALSAFTTTALAVHLIPLLLDRGHDAALAGTALAALGLMALPGRLVFTPLGDRWPRPAVTAAIFALQALGAAALLAGGGGAAVWVFVASCGAGFGAITPARATLLADFCGRGAYGAIGGALALPLACARAAKPSRVDETRPGGAVHLPAPPGRKSVPPRLPPVLRSVREVGAVGGADLDPAPARPFGLWNHDRQHALVEARLDLLLVHLPRQHERPAEPAPAPLRQVVRLALAALAARLLLLARDREHVVLHAQLDLVLLHAWQLADHADLVLAFHDVGLRHAHRGAHACEGHHHVVQEGTEQVARRLITRDRHCSSPFRTGSIHRRA